MQMEEGRVVRRRREEYMKEMVELLPVVGRWGSSESEMLLFWPAAAVEILKRVAEGGVTSGESLKGTISRLRECLCLDQIAGEGYAIYFDDLMSPEESSTWFRDTLPSLAQLLLRLPALLQSHYHDYSFGGDNDNSDAAHSGSVVSVLRVLHQQEAGMVLLSQELIAALLACSFFCLFPLHSRSRFDLPRLINFDSLFHCFYDFYSEMVEHKIKCILHYFQRVTSSMPTGFVSFHRKVLPLSYANSHFWANSAIPLCPFQVHSSGFIEDQSFEALEVDFANEYLGGGALHRGCVQEEIRFMINPELIAGMIFMPCMQQNEAIQINGAERFSNYTGYASSFRFSGDHVDTRELDSFKRRKTRIIAIDALCNPRMRQYELKCILRETNKAFCGFFDQSKGEHFQRLLLDSGPQGAPCNDHDEDDKDTEIVTRSDLMSDGPPSTSIAFGGEDGESMNKAAGNSKASWFLDHEDQIGIATGNWGCGAFGGDPELKAMIQWLAASQALRPFISYYTFGSKELRDLEQVSQWILSHEWTVGDLWNMLVEYSSQRHNWEAKTGFLTWLLPSLNS